MIKCNYLAVRRRRILLYPMLGIRVNENGPGFSFGLFLN